MKKVFLFLTMIFLMFSVTAQTEKKIVILHTNDIHSRLTGYAPESAYTPLTVNDDKTVGGFARIATVIKAEKELSVGNTLIVDAGDFLMGTLFQGLETKTGFQLRLMKTMGYDIACLGNHEFDYGPEKLAEIITSGVERGGIPALLLSNAVFNKKDPGDDSLEKLFTANIIGSKNIIERDGLKIGFFSLMGKVADENAAFAPPVTFSRQIPLAKKMVKELKAEKCDIIICLSHSGIDLDKNGNWTGEDVRLAEKVRGIDIIISGHTHTRLDKPLIVNGIPIVQSGEYGQFVGKLVIGYKNGKTAVEDYALIPIDDRIAGDPEVNRIIEEQKQAINNQILKPIGLDYYKSVAETDFLLECNEQGDIKGSNLGPLVADAIHSYINNHVKPAIDVSMVAVGVIRDKIVPGYQSAPDIFRVMSMGSGEDNIPGYPLAKLFVTGKELKSILEILQVAGNSTPANYCYYSGIRVEINPDKGLLKKITRIQIIHPDGITADVDFSRKNSQLYSIAANSYMLEFVGIIKKMSFGLINVIPKDSAGNPITDMKNAVIDFDENREGLQEGKEWLALMEFLGSMKDINGNGIPDIDNKYRTAVKCFFPVTGNKMK
jgi:5'-nucleotidase/UDP-sugar diphosphatase